MRNFPDAQSLILIFLTARPSAIKLSNGVLADTCLGTGHNTPAKDIADAKRRFKAGHKLYAKTRRETAWLANPVTAYDELHADSYEDIATSEEPFDRGISGRYVREVQEADEPVSVTTHNHPRSSGYKQVVISANSENIQTLSGKVKLETCINTPEAVIRELARRLSKYEPSVRVVMTTDMISGKNTLQIL